VAPVSVLGSWRLLFPSHCHVVPRGKQTQNTRVSSPCLDLIPVYAQLAIPAYADYAELEMAANRIRELRLEKAEASPRAFTVVALAQRLGVDASTLRSWERGSHRPTQRHLRALSRELGVSVQELAQQSES